MVTGCFKDKSTLIKCLIFLISLLIMILVALAITLTNRKEDNHVCKSEHCIALSAEVIRYTDKSMDACEDFHAFTCGRYIRNRKELPLPPPEHELNFMIGEMVKNGDSKPFIMQKSFYSSCANLGGIEMDDDATLLDLFFSLGDWPVLRGANWDGTLFEWTEVAKKSRRLGMKFDWFLNFSIYEDVNDTGLNILKIDIPENVFSLVKSEIFPRQKLFTKIALSLGAPEKLAHYETGRTIEFENDLGKLAEEYRGKRRNWTVVSLPKVTIDKVQEQWPNILWLDLINNMTGVRMMGSDHVIFDEVLEYVEDLNKLIYGTPKRIVADYMMWKIVEEWWQYLTQPVRVKFEEYYEVQYNRHPEQNRQKFCIKESRKQFPLIVESEYIRRHVTQQKQQMVTEMVFIIRNQFIKLVTMATWMNRDRRQRALRKLEEMKFLVGAPREIFDEFGFAENLGLYGFVFKSTNVVDMLTERRLRYYDNYFSVVNRGLTNRTERFYEKVVNITRFTVINDNTLVIPAAILRDAFYNPDLPNYFNYATLGKTLAHEIFEHIFERHNLFIDEENANYDSWSTSDVFEQAVKCLIKESFYFHNSEFKRPQIMRQFLADFIAHDVAYESYKEWSLMYPQESKLHGLEFTPGQLFWIHTSKLSCNKIYSKHDRDYSRFKIIGPLRNSRNFAKDYNCTEGSKMNPRKTCRIL